MKFYEVYGEFGVGKEMMATGRKGTLIIRVGQIVKVELCKRNGMVTSHSLFHPPCHGKVRVEHTCYRLQVLRQDRICCERSAPADC